MRPVSGYDADLRLAPVLAAAVERVTLGRFRAHDLRVETKPDLTLVSDADREAEELVRSQLKRTRPRDAVIGEEIEFIVYGSLKLEGYARVKAHSRAEAIQRVRESFVGNNEVFEQLTTMAESDWQQRVGDVREWTFEAKPEPTRRLITHAA